MEEEMDDDNVVLSNDSEYESSDNNDEEEPVHKIEIIKNKDHTIANILKNDKIQEVMHIDDTDTDTDTEAKLTTASTLVDQYKWLNRFKTTTCHMFLCINSIEYVRNERYPSEVYLKKYHNLYGNAFEVLIRDCKFYITTKLLQNLNANANYYPSEPVVKHADLIRISYILRMKMKDGDTLRQHILEALFNTLVIGVSNNEITSLKERLLSSQSRVRCDTIRKNYSWKSEDKKTRNLPVAPNQIQYLFHIMYKNKCPTFTEVLDLQASQYLADFEQKVKQLKKPVTSYIDCVSNVRLTIKELAAVLYCCNDESIIYLKNVDGDTEEVEQFLNLSMAHPKGDVILNLKTKDTNSQRYRLNCFKLNDVHVWVSSLVYSKTCQFDLESLIIKQNWGTHHIVTFKYVYNSLLNRYHSEVVKLVIRYILSKRPFYMLQNDLKVNSKFIYKYILLNSSNLPIKKRVLNM